MEAKTLNITLLLRNDLAASWHEKNPTLGKGELGVEIDTKRIKIGDGATAWNDLIYANNVGDLTLAKITDAGTAAAKDVGTGAGQVPMLNSNGKLDTSIIPAVAITDVFVVANEAAMLALNAEQGDIAIRSDIAKTYILTANTPTVLTAWLELKTPDCKVLSVNGKVGAVTLTTANIAEETNLYFTEERATANFEANIRNVSIQNLSGGADVLLSTDAITFNGGNA